MSVILSPLEAASVGGLLLLTVVRRRLHRKPRWPEEGTLMQPYWITTEEHSFGVGVTALSVDDAIFLYCSEWPGGPKNATVREIKDVMELDQNHVAPNMGNWLKRGIWFPLGRE
jgi:hypothetical protein